MMKTKLSFLVIVTMILLLLSACNTQGIQPNPIYTIESGKIVRLEITFFEYGSHGLYKNDTLKYALTSDVANLDSYINEIVNVQCSTISGYPVGGGPVYLQVVAIELAEQ